MSRATWYRRRTGVTGVTSVSGGETETKSRYEISVPYGTRFPYTTVSNETVRRYGNSVHSETFHGTEIPYTSISTTAYSQLRAAEEPDTSPADTSFLDTSADTSRPDTGSTLGNDTSCGGAPIAVAANTEDDITAGDDMDDNRQEQHLASMIHVLRSFLGNKATSSQWQKEMEIHGKWSKSSFDRRMRIVKARGWVGIVGDAKAAMERVSEGALFCVTDLYDASRTQASDQRQATGSVQGEDWVVTDRADGAASAARELLERLRKGKPPHAA